MASLFTSPISGNTEIVGALDVDSLTVQNGFAALPLGGLAVTSNTRWLPSTSVQWTAVSGAPNLPTFTLPGGGAFTYTQRSGLYRWTGNEFVYNLTVAGTLTTAPSPSNVGDYTLSLPTDYPIQLSAYSAAPEGAILGDLWLTTASNVSSNTFKAYAKTIPTVGGTSNASNVLLRVLTGTADDTLATIPRLTQITLQGTLTYATTAVGLSGGVPVAAFPRVAALGTTGTPGTADARATVSVGSNVAPAFARLQFHETSNTPALIAEQYAPTTDAFQIRTGTASAPVVSVVVDAVGNVGIGTAAPTAPLEVIGGTQWSDTAAYTSWVTRTSPLDATWYTIAWSPTLSIFAAGATSSTGTRLISSPDAITWTTRAMPATATSGVVRSIKWIPELARFVAVLSAGTTTPVLASTNGTTWTTATAPASEWYDVAWSPELSLLVAVAFAATGNGVMTSSNATTWTTRVTPSANWASVVWAPELALFVAVSSNNGDSSVITSADGVTWVTRTTPGSAWLSVDWSPELGLFAAVRNAGGTARAMTSPDGITWTSREVPVSNSWRRVLWVPEMRLFVATAITGTADRIMTSADGVTWTSRTSPASDNDWYGITWAPEISRLAAVGGAATAGTRVMTSDVLPATLQWSDGGLLGLGCTPAYQLDLSTDSARKLTGTTWLTGSDARLKTDIAPADPAQCRAAVAALPLRRFAWNADLPEFQTHVHDRHVLGWIAQEVAPVLPKAVRTLPAGAGTAYGGLSNVQMLDASQIYPLVYGTLQHLQQEHAALRDQLTALEARAAALPAPAHPNVPGENPPS